jgi:pimeloyl-ACP methyl ester carboxylesterase
MHCNKIDKHLESVGEDLIKLSKKITVQVIDTITHELINIKDTIEDEKLYDKPLISATTFPWADLPLREFITSDGATCFFYGRKASNCFCSKGTLLFVSGWSQGPNNWSPVLLTNEYVKKNYDVYVFVTRGYNQKLDLTGNSIARYATDVKEFIEAHRLRKLITVTHSMGCSVLWYLIGLYGEKYFDGYVVVDQPLQVLVNPVNSVERNLELGSIFTTDALFGFYNSSIVGPSESDAVRSAFELSCFTKKFVEQEPETYAKALDGVLKYQYQAVNSVIFNHACNDYLNVVSKGLKRPALLIGGKVSIVPWQTMVYQKQFYTDAQVKIFEADQDGSHSMYIENYSLFNQYLNEFLISNHN